MQHLRKGRKFGRVRKVRKALVRSLASSFFLRGTITTTEAKAKELRPIVERHLTKAKQMSLHQRRLFLKQFSPRTVHKIIEQGQITATRQGGYTRIVKLGQRVSDNAPIARLELIRK